MNSSSIITGAEGNNDFAGAFGTNPNRVNLNFTILDKGIADLITFNVDATNTTASEYEFAVTFNFTGHGHVNGFDMQLVNTPNAALTRFELFPDPALPGPFSTATGTAGAFAFETPNLNPFPNSAGPLRFGGLSGGGGHLINDGSTVTAFFTIDFADGAVGPNQSFALQFTANPEPSSAALAVLALGPLVLRRRRRNAA
ncbi:hypothetical protein Pla52nx_003368 [Stieleria varia]|uniref:hypothetical protein n=1 Tax=Stieleria varia TaxID=2528005 RepID=UPI00313D103E